MIDPIPAHWEGPRRIAELEVEVLRLTAALVLAVELAEDMIGYVPEYFREKWDHDTDLATVKAALTL